MARIKHIGDCHKCGRTGVLIAYGWPTRNGRHCVSCNRDRKQALERKKTGTRVPAEYPKGTPCFECGSTSRKLDRSHILSRGAHPELADDPDNIVPHCRECHNKWEFGDRRSMITFALKRAYMEKHSIID